VLRDQLGGGETVTHLDFSASYRVYREILLGFDPSSVPQVTKIAHLLAIGEREGWQSGGLSAFQIMYGTRV
jgi:hypothetical protein